MPSASLPKESERAAVAARGAAVVASSRPCPVCGEPMTGRRTSACSDKCRAAKSRRRRGADLALVEDALTRVLMRVRTLRGTAAGL
jgi:predicted nucleic acid-binding Zn ribbon protein